MGWMSILLFFFFLAQQVGSNSNNLVDLPAMMALQKELSMPEWDPQRSSNYCSWRGVRCEEPTTNGTVISLELPRRGLRGNLSLVSDLSSLKRLDLSANSFKGTIPSSLGNLVHLEYLDLSMNKLAGSIPPSLGNLLVLRSLNLSNNYLTGDIPLELKGLEKLRELQISSNGLTGGIPNWIAGLTGLKVLSAYENRLTGWIPPTLGSATQHLQVLNLHSNHLEGPIPNTTFSSGTLEILVLTMNRLNGTLPASVGYCAALSSLRIGNNRLTGKIPASVGNATSLTYFEADNNEFSGEIPSEFARCSNLTLLNLSGNRLTGTVPVELGVLQNLEELIVSGNELSGEIPRPLLRCGNLSKLDLSRNKFAGHLPENLCARVSRLQYLILGDNLLNGVIPRGIRSCTRLLELQLGGNDLVGTIPREMGEIKSLQIALNLSSNHLTGSLPRELGKLDKLVTLDVSGNRLSGGIPADFKGMQSLIDLNFSDNRLVGPIPVFSPFQKSHRSSFTGNTALCGEPLNLSCVPVHGGSAASRADRHRRIAILLAVIGSALVAFVSVVTIVLFLLRERREKEELTPKPTATAAAAAAAKVVGTAIVAGNVFEENMKEAVNLNSAVEATMKEANKFGSGTFSVVYKAVMPSGLILTVRRLRSVQKTVTYHQGKMIRELERMASLCHKNLMRPIGFVIYEDVALLLHPFMVNGTLAQLLHGVETASPSPSPLVAGKLFQPDWPRRLSVAIGAAEGLSFLHHVGIIHLDVSSGNVFLDGRFNALLGEFEISKLLDPSKGTASSISAVAGSFGYIPPEYAYTMQVTVEGNVYSYGVVLLEILTSRWPIDEAFGEGMDLVKWVHGASARGETPEQIMDPKLSTVSFAWRKQMLEVLRIAMMCTDHVPTKRPKMKKVVELLVEASRG